MRFNCVHTFSLEASDREDFDAKIARYGELLRKASERLDINYQHGLVLGNPSAGQAPVVEPEDDEPLETLFDD